jgi:nucleoside-diphosphate-sugar epimerase
VTCTVDRIEGVEHLETLLSEPSDTAMSAMSRLSGDLIVLGVGGKMGPTLARMARSVSDRAGVRRRVIGVARFSDSRLETRLHGWGIETICCDLLDPAQLEALPEVPNVVFMTGMKFGSTGQESLTWAMNCWLPGTVCRKFRRSRIVAFSTGNVYSLTPVERGGSVETDTLAPVGEYAMSCAGRERIFEYFSRIDGMPMAILRLNYATELRYGVLVDIAQRVLARQPVDLTMGYLNAIWQADANAMALTAFDHLATPPRVINISGPETLRVRRVAEEFGRRFGRGVQLSGSESADALLSNGQVGHRLLGKPQVTTDQMVTWIADWLARGGETLGKPTHFEVRDGKF